jgi:K+-sensing histidine kinase KdpD
MNPSESSPNALINTLLIIIHNSTLKQNALHENEANKTQHYNNFVVDVRNLLTVIRISVSILQNYQEHLTPERHKHFLQRIDDQANEISRLLYELSQSNQQNLDANPT